MTPPICIINPSLAPLGLAFNIRSSFSGPVMVLPLPLPNVRFPFEVIDPAVTVPVVVIAPAPTSIDVNPEVIEPAFNAPVVNIPVPPAIGEYIVFIFTLLSKKSVP